ncbi:glycosyltransferase family 2 protein [Litchfieldia salsa]|uniref:Glycosyltransferase involved in cell wall bisynthesis n=1 Tax=Litchfieldia salsa TaxID=930152 RepID=A0A1H0WYW8_9BACI|nr:glycosyltransferase [Litchfieldia salsa]SDP95635.1 Glycosyltransferase involved in cell wall bisynthesis [Litchfieldia salsa]
MKNTNITKSNKKVSVIIPAQNEEKMIGKLIKEFNKLDPFEIIVVVNGSTDQTKKIAESLGVKVIEYNQALGKNVPRAIGAYHAEGDILLFMDGDQFIPAYKFMPFIKSIHDGVDIALNDFSWLLKRKVRPHPTAIVRKALNLFLKKEELDIDSFVSIPHAVSRKAVDLIGWWNFADTAVALTLAVEKNLTINSPIAIDVIRNNAYRSIKLIKAQNSPFAKSHDTIIGDHVFGLYTLIQQKGSRGGFQDSLSRRFIFKRGKGRFKKQCVENRSAVIMTHRGAGQLQSIISTLAKLEIKDIILIDHENSGKLLFQNVTILETNEKYVPNLDRLSAAKKAKGEVVLFLDGNQKIDETKIEAFYKSVETTKGIAINDVSYCLQNYPIGSKNSIYFFLNILLKKPNLSNCSLNEYPHAIHHQVLQEIGLESLLIPPLAYVKAVLSGIPLKVPCRVNLEEDLENKNESTFLGDHLEAVNFIINHTNKRGGFSDGTKDRNAIQQLKEVRFYNGK